MRPPAPTHYLRHNHTVWTPGSVIFLDTETRVLPDTDPEVLALRLWDARYVDRRPRKGVTPRDEYGQGDTAGQLAAWITDVTRNRESVWLYCHNLAFDLTTTRLPLTLTALGWNIGDAAIGGRAPWLTMRRGKRVLTVADSGSWLPMPLEQIGQLAGVPKLPLPDEVDTDEAWHARCRGDVDTLAAAMLALMAWWDEHKLGRWAISGAASGWNAYRHTPLRLAERACGADADPAQVETTARLYGTVLVDPAPATVKSERAYVHGGRRGTWVIGEHGAGPFAELDFTAAYPTVAATLPLPCERVRPFESLDVGDQLVHGGRWGITARVRVRTDVPRWPVRYRRRTWYPVGEFWADLAGPDIAEAARLGCLLEIGPGHVHKLSRHMAPWATWVLDVAAGLEPDTPEVARAVAKTWGRSVIGKWSAHAFERVKLGPSPEATWGHEDGWDHSADCPAGIVDLAGVRWLVTASGTPDNAYPAIQAWVEAEVRSRLNRVIEALGPGCVLQCDTDGLIAAERTVATRAAGGHLVAPRGLGRHQRMIWALDQIDPVAAPLTLRVKRTHDTVTVLGPQHLRLGGTRRFAGLPGTAVEESPGHFRAKLWPKLAWQMSKGSPLGYVRPEIAPTVTGPWPTGWVLDDNTVVPVEARIGADGATQLIDWNSSRYARAGRAASRLQHPDLERL